MSSLPAPPPPLRETIFSTEIRSVEYEKSEEQKETVLFDDIGESLMILVLFDDIGESLMILVLFDDIGESLLVSTSLWL